MVEANSIEIIVEYLRDYGENPQDYMSEFPTCAASLLEVLAEENKNLKKALTPSIDTKAAYMGEFQFNFPVFDRDGNEVMLTPNVPWTAIKDIMRAIREYAGVN